MFGNVREIELYGIIARTQRRQTDVVSFCFVQFRTLGYPFCFDFLIFVLKTVGR